MEVIFPSYLKHKIIHALIEEHPYEEVAYDIVALSNEYNQTGSGLIGELEFEISEEKFLMFLKDAFNLKVIKHTKFLNRPVKKIAVCGGAGSFLIHTALTANADVYITSDIKYHEFFDANNKILIADIGHWESEQFTIDLLHDFLQVKFPTFAVLKTGLNTNPVHYFT
jgi:putative NIF3 family GTP cyclohydrolase 1 type 2